MVNLKVILKRKYKSEKKIRIKGKDRGSKNYCGVEWYKY